jgi:hypothetical protein
LRADSVVLHGGEAFDRAQDLAVVYRDYQPIQPNLAPFVALFFHPAAEITPDRQLEQSREIPR